MKALIDLCKRTIAVDGDEVFVNALKDEGVQAKIVSFNIIQMYDEGIDSDGNSLGQYAQITVEYYKPLAKTLGGDGRTDHITLKDSGDFYKSFRVKLLSDGFQITADAIKEDTDLSVVYPKVIGLTSESKAMVAKLITPSIVDLIRKEILR